MGALILELVAREVELPELERRLDAARRIAEMQLPVDDWPVMEDQIEASRLRDDCLFRS